MNRIVLASSRAANAAPARPQLARPGPLWALLALAGGLWAMVWLASAPAAPGVTTAARAVPLLPAAMLPTPPVSRPAVPPLPPVPGVDRAERVRVLAARTGSLLMGDLQALEGLPRWRTAEVPDEDVDAAFAALLDGHVQHARRCTRQRCEVWIVGPVKAGASRPAAPPSAPRSERSAAPLEVDPPGLFPAD